MVFTRSLCRLSRPAGQLVPPRLSSLTHRGVLALRQPIAKRAGLNQRRWLTEAREKVKVLMVLYEGGKHAQEEPNLLGEIIQPPRTFALS